MTGIHRPPPHTSPPPPHPRPTCSPGTSSLLLQGFGSGSRNNEASKFTGLIGTAFGETQQMGPNCRPVVGTLLTNTQGAVHRAFWNRMRLGSWGRRSNYRHLSFLFNEGGCGARPCWRQPVRERCQGVRTRAVARCLCIGRGLSPFSPGPDMAFRGEDGSPGILRRQPQTVREARSRGPWVHRVYYAFLLKSSS